MRSLVFPSLVVALAAFLWAPSRCLADDPKALRADPEARRLLDEIVASYKALENYADHGEFTVAATSAGKEHVEVLQFRLTFARLNRLDFSAGPVRLASDGKNLTTVIEPLREYLQEPAPKRIDLETLRRGPAGSIVFGGPGGPALELLWSLLTEPEPLRTLADLGGTVKLDADQELDNARLRVLRVERDSGPNLRVLVDPETKLLKRIDWLFDRDKPLAGFPDRRNVALTTFRWSAGDVSTKPLDKNAFAFEVPKGYHKIEPTVAAEEDQEAAKYPVLELVGKPAPDFTLTVLDGPGKTRTLALADLAGKIVVIDFWATWCAPCIAELPDVQKLIESYGKEKKDIVVVALSQDQRPADLAEVRKLVEKKLSEEKLDLTSTPVGRIGLDPSGTVGEAFQITALPTIVILDAKGTVQAAHVGVNPREVLTRDIDALLEGKTLAKPKNVKAGAAN